MAPANYSLYIFHSINYFHPGQISAKTLDILKNKLKSLQNIKYQQNL